MIHEPVKAPYNVTVTKIDGDDVLFDFEPAKPIISTEIAEGYVSQQAEAEGITTDLIIAQILKDVPKNAEMARA